MNVILTSEEVAVVMSLVVSRVLDHAPISDAAKETIRQWRKDHDVGGEEVNQFAFVFNEALGNHIDGRTARMIQRRGQIRVPAVMENA